MARKSRKITKLPQEGLSAVSAAEIFRTAIYARISVETEEKRIRGSMDNQVEFLRNYVDLQEELKLVEIYIDDDITGTNFDRPAFNKLLEDVKKGRINCIVVKDLSRFGRNYVETGEFIEKIFPFLKVRFIAINDRFDSLINHSDIVASFKNIVNEIYAKDISKKICTSVITRQKKGEYIGGITAYGYMKDPNDKHRLLVDPITAPIVKQIFDWKASGIGFITIGRMLNNQGIMSPAQYKHSRGIFQKDKNQNHPWNAVNVKRILLNPIYMGNMVQGKYRQSFYKNQPRIVTDESQWIVIPDTHEAIIEKGTFEAVKQQLSEHNARRKNSENIQNVEAKNLFKGLIYCGQCGKKMVFTSRTGSKRNPKKVYASYKCRHYRERLNQECADKRIQNDVLVKIIEKLLAEYSKVFIEDWNEFSKNAAIRQGDCQSNEAIQKSNAVRRLEKIDNLDIKLYTDYAEGLLTKNEYVQMKGNYRSESTFLQNEIDVLEKQIVSKGKIQEEINNAKCTVEAFIKGNNLSEEIIRNLIERITIQGRNAVEIRFKFEPYFERGKLNSILNGEGENIE